jgi:hypothetical protein
MINLSRLDKIRLFRGLSTVLGRIAKALRPGGKTPQAGFVVTSTVSSEM